QRKDIPYYGVKEAVFPFNMFPEVDPLLGPEMRSTGEVLGLAKTAGEAYLKAIEASGTPLPESGTVLISVNRKDKPEVPQVAKIFHDCGFKLMATGRTCDLIESCDIPVTRVKKIYEGRPNIIDYMTNGEIQLIVNSPVGKQSAHDDSYLRKNAIKLRIPYLTTMAAAKAAAEGLQYVQRQGTTSLQSLQSWHDT
ncbi:MAG: carbamoyl phosphate synthase large subunit, partial [Lachnospiraceae bacterium]|nr:carbamoyl phosphate synthase large subunit [Lachnospiraceae bacterium]